jgi:hypothetical protein
MLSWLKNFWRVVSTGWVIEYPGEGREPIDFFDRKDRMPYGVTVLTDGNELERCGWRGEEARGR